MPETKKGIEYQPDINYRLEEVPPHQYVENITEPQNYTGSDTAQQSTQKAEIDLDFLLEKAEDKLSDYDNFEDYKEAVVNKCYCRKPLSTAQAQSLNNFKEKNGGIDGDITLDIYPRLLNVKSDMQLDKKEIERLKQTEINILNSYMDKFANFYTQEPYNIDPAEANMYKVYDTDTKVEHYQKLAQVNQTISNLEQKIEELKEKRKQAIKDGRSDRADLLQKKINKAEADISKVRNRVSYLASEGYALHRKAEITDSYLMKLGYNLLASPLDRLDGTVCCLIKLLIKQLEVSDDIEEAQQFLNNMNLDELKESLDAIRGILFMSYQDSSEILGDLENMLRNMVMAPVRTILSEAIGMLRSFEAKVISKTEKLFDGILHSDMENPDNVLDCLYFESFADFIHKEIEGVFKDIEEKILDLYKFLYKQTDFYDEDSIQIGHKDKIQQIYGLLTKLSEAIDAIDSFSVSEGIEEWIQSFLIKSGFGTKYNSQTGDFETINLEGCLDSFDNDFSYHKFLPDRPEEKNEIDLTNNKEFQDFKDSYITKTYNCSIRENNLEENMNDQMEQLDQKLKDLQQESV